MHKVTRSARMPQRMMLAMSAGGVLNSAMAVFWEYGNGPDGLIPLIYVIMIIEAGMVAFALALSLRGRPDYQSASVVWWDHGHDVSGPD